LCRVVRHVKRIVILNRIFLVSVDDICALLNGVTSHFAEVILYLQLRWVVPRGQSQVKVVLIMPLQTLKGKLLLREDALSQHPFLTNHLELIRWVHNKLQNYHSQSAPMPLQ
jgi:hypothetical protein